MLYWRYLMAPPVVTKRKLAPMRGQGESVLMDAPSVPESGGIEEAILRSGATYLLLEVGDGVAMGTPVGSADGWEVPVFLARADKRIGTLRYTLGGDLLPEASTSVRKMDEASQAS
jgi:hypothetical protein